MTSGYLRSAEVGSIDDSADGRVLMEREPPKEIGRRQPVYKKPARADWFNGATKNPRPGGMVNEMRRDW